MAVVDLGTGISSGTMNPSNNTIDFNQTGNPTAAFAVTDTGSLTGSFNVGDAVTGTITTGLTTTVSVNGGHYVGYTTVNGTNYAVIQLADGTYYGLGVDVPANSTEPFTAAAFTPACYLAGTCITTSEGEVAVERLRIGDSVITASGEARRIRWIGTRVYSARFARNNPKLFPILITQGALADNVPSRDLCISPKHAMFLDGALIPAELLLNGITIMRASVEGELAYYHIELESHDLLIAEGAPSESFADDGSRNIFQNASTYGELYPDTGESMPQFCAPRVTDGPTLDAVLARLSVRAGFLAAA